MILVAVVLLLFVVLLADIILPMLLILFVFLSLLITFLLSLFLLFEKPFHFCYAASKEFFLRYLVCLSVSLLFLPEG